MSRRWVRVDCPAGMPEWPQIINTHGELVWTTVCRLAPDHDPAERFTETFLAAQQAAHRDAVSDWRMLLQHIAARQCLAALRVSARQQPPAGAPRLRVAVARLPEAKGAAFALRYVCRFSYPEIAMELRAPLETIGPMISESCTSVGRTLVAAQAEHAEQSQEQLTGIADDLLERAVSEMNGAAIPPLDPRLVQRATDAVMAAPEVPFEKPPQKSRAIPIGIAAAIVVIILSVIGARIYNQEPPPAFALDDVIRAVEERSAVSYHLSRTLELSGGRTRRLRAEITVVRSEQGAHQLRQVMPPPDSTIIWDFAAGTALTLDDLRMRATLRDVDNMLEEQRPVDVLAWLRMEGISDARPTVQRNLQGRRAQGFDFKRDGMQVRLWADARTRLPLLVEATGDDLATPQSALLTDFNWEPAIDAAQFALEPPEGYELTAQRVDLSPASEIDLMRALDIAARYNGGQYPKQFDRKTIAPLILQQDERLPEDRGSLEYQMASERLGAELRQLGRGFLFVAENGEDWQYAGGGVFIGSRDPVLWYRPSGSSTYRIINGDLVVRVVPADRLPEVPAVPIPRPSGSEQRLGN